MEHGILYKDWLAVWLERRRGYVKEATHANYTTAAVTHIIPALGELCGLRHTFATRLIENGADYKTESELLGHASVNITLNAITEMDSAGDTIPNGSQNCQDATTTFGTYVKTYFDAVDELTSATCYIKDDIVTAAIIKDGTYTGAYPTPVTDSTKTIAYDTNGNISIT